MKQGVLSANRVRLLLHKGVSCYRQRRRGERKRKSVRGCIVAADLAVLNLVVTKKGDQEIPGLTDAPVPRRLGPKRANNIRKLFNLSKVRDARAFRVTACVDGLSGLRPVDLTFPERCPLDPSCSPALWLSGPIEFAAPDDPWPV